MRWSVILVLALACKSEPDPEKDKGPQETDTVTDTVTTDTVLVEWPCELEEGVLACDAADSSDKLGCALDFDALASLPLDASIPGARSVKTIVDRTSDDALYFMNSVKYPIHWDFASEWLSADDGFQSVPDLALFNSSEYYSPDRRFILGAIIYYEDADIWTYEIAPYDTASPEMVTTAINKIRENAWFGPKLKYHPSSQLHENEVVPGLPADIPIVTTDELFAGVDFQTYNPGETTGILTFRTAAEVDGTYTPYRELVVLDAIPNEISIVAGIITGEFQTPLAHINVLSVNRGTPNMGLKDAQDNETLKALEGKWVRLIVEPFSWSIEEISFEEAEAYFEENLQPDPITVPDLDLSVTALTNIEDVVTDGEDLPEQIQLGLTRFGSKGTNYAGIYDIDRTGKPWTIQEGYVIPFYWYDKHVREHGLYDQLIAMMAEPEWSDPAYRVEKLEQFKLDIVAAPLDPVLVQRVKDMGEDMWPGQNTRFRSSTNAEDLGTFTGAGLYNSQTGDPELDDEDEGSIEWAIKEAWANLWNPRAYEERSYYSIDQTKVAMALLTTSNFPEEEANGVAITNNIFDTSGLEPAFYVNVQTEGFEVVQPGLGIIPDSYIQYFYTPGTPVVYISHSNLVPIDETVLTEQQVYELGVGLDQVHQQFLPVYGLDGDWYGMDVEFKLDDKETPGDPIIYIKQARPFPWTPGGADLSVCD